MAGSTRRRVADLLAETLRRTWPATVAVLCASFVDAVRPRGWCGTYPEFLAVPLFLASLGLCGLGAVTTVRGLARGRSAATVASVAINVYAIVVSLVLALPYA